MEQGKYSAIRKQEEQKMPWITDKMIEKVDDRRKWKQQYRRRKEEILKSKQ